MQTKKLFHHIEHKLLGKDLIEQANTGDPTANGVQVWGGETVKKIAIGVSCNAEFLDKAIRWGADACIFKHGLGLYHKYIVNSRLDIPTQKQLRLVLQNDLTIAGYHYPLDVHPTLGNASIIIDKLGAKRLNMPYMKFWGLYWGYVAEFKKPTYVEELAKECTKLFKNDVKIVLGGPEKIKRIGVATGGAKPSGEMLFELIDKQIELHITGEIDERGPSIAKESGFNYFSCGHYATEVFGPKALAEAIQNDFPQIEVQFIDVWNEL
jgi:dinuclear metal center YbgI/SA1388 family protein